MSIDKPISSFFSLGIITLTLVGLVYGNIWRYFEKNNKKIILKKNNLPQGLILGNLLKNYLIRLSSMVIRKSYLNKLSGQKGIKSRGLRIETEKNIIILP